MLCVCFSSYSYVLDVSDIRVSMFYISLQMYTFSVKYNTFPTESVIVPTTNSVANAADKIIRP